MAQFNDVALSWSKFRRGHPQGGVLYKNLQLESHSITCMDFDCRVCTNSVTSDWANLLSGVLQVGLQVLLLFLI